MKKGFFAVLFLTFAAVMLWAPPFTTFGYNLFDLAKDNLATAAASVRGFVHQSVVARLVQSSVVGLPVKAEARQIKYELSEPPGTDWLAQLKSQFADILYLALPAANLGTSENGGVNLGSSQDPEVLRRPNIDGDSSGAVPQPPLLANLSDQLIQTAEAQTQTITRTVAPLQIQIQVIQAAVAPGSVQATLDSLQSQITALNATIAQNNSSLFQTIAYSQPPPPSALSITDADIPDTITVSKYLLLTGGTLSGDLAVPNLAATSTASGFGTSTPYATLSVEIPASSKVPAFVVSDSGTSTPVLAAFPSGNVGIATNSPSFSLAVGGSGYFSDNLTITGNVDIQGTCVGCGTPGGLDGHVQFNDATNGVFAGNSGLLYSSTNLTIGGDLAVNGSDLNIGNGISATSTLSGEYGKLGLGTTSPWGLFSVESTAQAGSNTPIFVVGDSGTSSPFIYVSGANGSVGIGTSSPWGLTSIEYGPNVDEDVPVFVISDAGTTSPQFIIDYQGKVGIGVERPQFSFQIGALATSSNVADSYAINPVLGFSSTSTYQGYWYQMGGNSIKSSWGSYARVDSMASYNGELYAGIEHSSDADAEVWKYNGTVWAQIGGDTLNSSWTDTLSRDNAYLTTYNGKLYVGLSGTADGDGEVWEYNGVTWVKIGGDAVNSSWADTTFKGVQSLVVYNGKLYAGLTSLGFTAGNAEVWEYNGSTWTRVGGDAVNSSWADATYESITSMTAYNGKLYASVGISAGEGEIWEYNGTAWTQIGGDNLNSSWTTAKGAQSMTVYNGKLYAGLGVLSFVSAGDAEVWEYNGATWKKVGGDAINSSWADATYELAFSMSAYNGKLYVGLGGNRSDIEVWEYNGSAWTRVGGSDNYYPNWVTGGGSGEIDSLFVYNGKLYAGIGAGGGYAQVWQYDTGIVTLSKNGSYGATIGNILSVGRNNYVGINNSEPQAALDVVGDLRVGGSTIIATSSFVGFGTSSPWGLVSVEHQYFETGKNTDDNMPIFVVGDYGTSAPSFMIRNSDGYVGVATDSPGATFAVTGDAIFSGLTALNNVDIQGTCTGCGQNPSGSDTQIQFNNADSFGGNSGLTYTSTNLTVGGDLHVNGSDINIGNGISATSTFHGEYGKLGVGTTSPFGQFSIEASTLVGSGTPIFVIGDQGTTTPLVYVSGVSGYTGFGTSSPWGRVSVEIIDTGDEKLPSFVVADNGTSTPALAVYSSGVVTIENLQTGALAFETNAGQVSWMDMPVTSAASAGTAEGYSAQIDTNTLLSVAAESDAAGSIRRLSVGVATTTPYGGLAVDHFDQFGLSGNSKSDLPSFVVQDQGSSTPSIYVRNYNGFVGFGTSSPYGQVSIEMSNFQPDNEGIPAFVIGSRGTTTPVFTVGVNATSTVGIGTSSPSAAFGVVGNAIFGGNVSLKLNEFGGSSAVCHTGANTDYDMVTLTDCTTGAAADYAEHYPMADASIDYGDIVAASNDTTVTSPIYGEPGRTITKLVKSSQPYQSTAIGIVSNNYSDFTSTGYNIKPEDNPKPVALSGRVPVKVNLENGPIKIGDPITSSSEPGIGMKATKSGRIVGYALEDFNSLTEQNKGQVLVIVNNGFNLAGELEQPPSLLAQLVDSVIEKVKEWFASALVAIKDLVVDKFQIGTSDKPTGVTIYDLETKKPYCLAMRGGQPEYVPGQCTDGNPSQPSSLPDPSSPSEPPQPSDTEAPVITLNGLNPTQIEKGSVYSDMGATVTDNKDQNLGYKVTVNLTTSQVVNI
ncbi:MAG: FG-GAP repeat protein, partial [Candidatus Giovannonibacteria bacterium GW2011_GWB1_47_6b]